MQIEQLFTLCAYHTVHDCHTPQSTGQFRFTFRLRLIWDCTHGHHETVLNCHVMCHQPSSMWCNAVTVIVIVIIVHLIAAITCEQLMAEEQASWLCLNLSLYSSQERELCPKILVHFEALQLYRFFWEATMQKMTWSRIYLRIWQLQSYSICLNNPRKNANEQTCENEHNFNISINHDMWLVAEMFHIDNRMLS